MITALQLWYRAIQATNKSVIDDSTYWLNQGGYTEEDKKTLGVDGWKHLCNNFSQQWHLYKKKTIPEEQKPLWEQDFMKTLDCYNKKSYMEYLEFMKTPTVFGTEYDIIMLCEFLKVSIKVFSPSLFSDKQGMCHCEEPPVFGDMSQTVINLWLSNEHYEPIIKI
jgi:hypothetical protein